MAKRRRTRGDGALYQRHSHETCPPMSPDGTRPEHRCQGRWVGNHVVTIDGTKIRKTVYGRTQKQAKLKLEQLKKDAEAGTVVRNTLTVEGWATRWLVKIETRKLRPYRPQTLNDYASKTNRYIIPLLGHHRLTALKPHHIEEWHETLATRGGRNGKPVSAATVRQAHLVLSRCLKDAVRAGKLGVNPMDKVDPPYATKTARQAFTVQQAHTALDVAGDDLRVWLAVFYGLRQGEALGLRWGDVDLDAPVPTLTINQTLQRGKGNIIEFGPPKTKRSHRTLPLLPEMVRRFRLHQPAGAQPEHLVFTHNGGPVPPHKDLQAWYDHLTAAGLPALPLHSARHTAASVLADAGVPAWLVARILGHGNVTMTDHYTHEEPRQITGAFQSAALVLDAAKPKQDG